MKSLDQEPPSPEDSSTESHDSFVVPNWIRQLYGGRAPTPQRPRIDESQIEYTVTRTGSEAQHQSEANSRYTDTIAYIPEQLSQPTHLASAVVHPDTSTAPGLSDDIPATLDINGSYSDVARKLSSFQTQTCAKTKAQDEEEDLEGGGAVGGIKASTASGENIYYKNNTSSNDRIPSSKNYLSESKDPANGVDWTTALKKRGAKQLKQYTKDLLGVHIPSSARPFDMFASPKDIAEASSGLGVYFSTVLAVIFIALLLGVCYIYPLVDNATHQRWAHDYSLYVKPTAQRESAVCAKHWSVSSWMTEMTPGGHCAFTTYSSSYDCAAKCTWSPERLKNPTCASQPMPTYFSDGGRNGSSTSNWSGSGSITNRTAACQQHLPCGKVTDPSAPDGPCYCCEMTLDLEQVATNDFISTGQLWVFFLGQFFFLCWLLIGVISIQKRTVNRVGRYFGVADYSVLIKGIPRKRADDEPLARFCADYGNLKSAFNIPSVGDALRVGNRVTKLSVDKAEAEAQRGIAFSCNPLQWLFRWLVVGNYQGVLKRLDKEKFKLEIYERVANEPSGHALASFIHCDSTANCLADFERPPVRKWLDSMTCGLTTTTPKLHGASIEVIRAPEPSDIIWEHINCTGTSALLRRIWSFCLTALLIVLGAGLQYGIAVLANQLRESRMEAEYAAGNGSPEAAADAADKAVTLRLTSVVAAVMVVTVNLLIAGAVRRLSLYERWTTRSSMERWVMIKLAVSQLTNSFAAPVLAAWASGNKAAWYSRGGLSEAALMTQCAMAVVPALMHLLAPGNLLNRYLFAKRASTQAMLERLLAPPEFWLAEQYAAAVNTLGLAVLYAPMLPASPFIAAIGLSIGYWANKYYALRIAATPGNLSGQVQTTLNPLLRLLPLLQLILMRYLYFKGHPGMPAVFYTGLAVWLLFTIAPIRGALGAFTKRERSLDDFAQMPYDFIFNMKNPHTGKREKVEVYFPKVPSPCSKSFRGCVLGTFGQLYPVNYLSENGGGHDDETDDINPLHYSSLAALAGGGRRADVNIKRHVVEDKYPTYVNHRIGGGVGGMHTMRGSLVGGLKEALRMMWDPNEVEDLDNPPTIGFKDGVEFVQDPYGFNNGGGGGNGGGLPQRYARQDAFAYGRDTTDDGASGMTHQMQWIPPPEVDRYASAHIGKPQHSRRGSGGGVVGVTAQHQQPKTVVVEEEGGGSYIPGSLRAQHSTYYSAGGGGSSCCTPTAALVESANFTPARRMHGQQPPPLPPRQQRVVDSNASVKLTTRNNNSYIVAPSRNQQPTYTAQHHRHHQQQLRRADNHIQTQHRQLPRGAAALPRERSRKDITTASRPPIVPQPSSATRYQAPPPAAAPSLPRVYSNGRSGGGQQQAVTIERERSGSQRNTNNTRTVVPAEYEMFSPLGNYARTLK